MPLNNSIAYGISAILQIAQAGDDDPLSNKELCKRVQMPEAYVLQILRKLRVAGLLKSTRGVQGGYNLARPLEEISVLDVCNALDMGMQWQLREVQDYGNGDNKATDSILASIASQVRTCLRELKLSELL